MLGAILGTGDTNMNKNDPALEELPGLTLSVNFAKNIGSFCTREQCDSLCSMISPIKGLEY